MKTNFTIKYLLGLIILLTSLATFGQNDKVQNANYPDLNDGYIEIDTFQMSNPLTYLWSTGETTGAIYNLVPGSYVVTITDVNALQEILTFVVGVTNNHYQFPWTPATSANFHQIHIPGGNAVSISGYNLMPGDEIGVFNDSIDDWECGGMITWNGNAQTLYAYYSANGHGFQNGGSFHFLIRSNQTGVDYVATPQYDSSYANDSTYQSGGESSLLSLTASNLVLQSSLLQAGFNDFLVWVDPLQSDPAIVFQVQYGPPMVFTLNKLVNGVGQIYFPLYNINTIGNLLQDSLYVANMGSTDVVQFLGYYNDLSGLQLSVNIETTMETCVGNNASAWYNGTGGLPPYTFLWSDTSTGDSISGLTAGSYQVTVWDSNADSVVVPFSVILDSLNVSEFITHETGAGNDGAIYLFVNGGTLPYTYQWSNGGTTLNSFSLTAGIYSLTITDGNLCDWVYSYEIFNQIIPLALTSTLEDVTCFGSCDGSIDVNTTGGTPPYSFIWSDGSSTEDLTGLCAGAYTVTISDGGVGSSTLPWTYTNTGANATCLIQATDVNGASPDVGDFIGAFYDDGSNLYCFGYTEYTGGLLAVTAWGDDSGTSGVIDGFPNGASFTWKLWRASDGNVVDMTASYQSGPIAYSTNGTSIISTLSGNYTSSGSGGSSINLTFNVTEPLAISIVSSIQHETAIGGDGAIDITASNGVAPYTYQWSTGAITEDISGLTSGTYTVSVSDANGCMLAESFIVNNTGTSALSSTGLVTNVLCNGSCTGTVDLTTTGGTPPYSYSWSNGSVTEDAVGLCSGTYTVTISDGSVGSNILPWTYTNTGSNATCLIQAVDVNGALPDVGDYIGAFYDDGLSLLCCGYAEYTGGLFAVTAWGDDAGTSGVVDGFPTGAAYTWKLWRASDGDVVDMTANYISGPVTYAINATNIITSLSGAYTSSGGGSSSTPINLTFNITEPAMIAVTGTVQDETALGADGSIDVTVSGGVAPYSFLWSTGSSGEDLVGLVAGTYSISISDANGCVFSESFILNGVGSTSLSSTGLTSDILCNGDCTGTIDLTTTGGTPPYSYSWSNGSSTEDLTGLCAGSYTVTISDGSVGSNILPWTYTNTGANATCLIQAADINGASPDVGDFIGAFYDDGSNLYCFGYTEYTGGIFAVTAWGDDAGTSGVIDGFPNGATFIWKLWRVSDGDVVDMTANYLTGQTTYSTNASIIISSLSGAYTSSGGGSSSNAISLTFNINEPSAINPLAGILDATSADNDGGIQFKNLAQSGGTPPFSIFWSNGASSNSIQNLSAGTYSVTLIDANSCSYSQTYTVANQSSFFEINVNSIVTDVLCFGASNGEINITPSGGMAPYNYTWSNGATTEDLNGLNIGAYNLTISDLTYNGYPATVPWSYTQTGNPHVFEFSDGAGNVYVSGAAPFVGSTIGAFYIDNGNLKCGGYAVIPSSGSSFSVNVWPDDTTTMGIKEGFAEGEAIIWQLDEFGTAFPMIAWYSSLKTDAGHFVNNGQSGLVWLVNSYSEETLSFTITEPTGLSVVGLIQNESAAGADGSIDITISGGVAPYSYQWSNGSSSEDLVGLVGGSYSLTVTNVNGCAITETFTLTSAVPQLVASAIVQDALCYGDCNGEIDLTITGGIPPYTYLWSNASTSEDQTALCAGTYAVTISDVLSNTIIGSFTVNEPDLIDISEQIIEVTPSVGNDGAINVSVSGGTLPYAYSWSSGASSPNITGLSYGLYSLTITDANGCQVIENYQVDYSGIYLSYDMNVNHVACFGASTGSAWVDNVVGVAPFTYLWSNGATTSLIENLPAGQYDVSVTGANGDLITNMIIVSQADELVADLTVTPIDPVAFVGGIIDIAVTGGASPYAYTWSNGLTTQTGTNLGYGDYFVTVVDANMCETVAEAFVTVLNAPQWNIDESAVAHTIHIPLNAAPQINGVAVEMYDFIGAFYDSAGVEYCGGFVVWSQSATSLIVFGDDTLTTAVEGFGIGEQFEWKIWDASTNTHYLAAASYDLSYTHDAYFALNGESGLDSLQVATISGTVSTSTKGNLPVGMIVLYEPTQGSYYAVENGLISNGQFEVEGILPGDYLVYAIPEPGLDHGVPGYFIHRKQWQNASLVHVEAHTAGVNIALDPVIVYATGNGAISGTIYAGADASYNNDVFGGEWFPSGTKADGTPARNIPILLFDAQMNVMDFRLSNEQGAFQFDNMELGKYYVQVEKAGLQSDPIEVILSQTNLTYEGLIFTLNDGAVTSVQKLDDIDIAVYPNPVTDQLTVAFEGKAQFKLFTITGQEIALQKVASDQAHQIYVFDLTELTAGIYLLEVVGEKQRLVQKISKN